MPYECATDAEESGGPAAVMNVQTTFLVQAVRNGKPPRTIRHLSYGARQLAPRGIDYDVWVARGCWRYKRGEAEKVWSAFERHIPRSQRSKKRGQVTKVVNQCTCPDRDPDRFWEKDYECPSTCGGWVMPKWAPPDFPKSIAPQLRPDDEVVLDPFGKWHTHGTLWGDPDPRFPEETGIVYPEDHHLAGEPKHLPREWVMAYGTAECEAHINGTGDQYDPETGEGAHNGEDYPGVHYHVRVTAKYILITPDRPRQKRGMGVDMHPWARERLDDADVVYLAMEGIPKTDAIITAGGCAFGIPSVTFWNKRELIRVAEKFLIPKQRRLYIIPDADGVDKPEVMRQAYNLRTLFRRAGVEHVFCAAPPIELFRSSGKKIKGVDDYLGAGYRSTSWRSSVGSRRST
jgi:hypothetical protein